MAKPFLKVVGGKRQLVPQLMKHAPESFGAYREPFLGGGALFFHLQAQGRIKGDAILSDTNERLIRTYRAVRDTPTELVARVTSMPIDKQSYLSVRSKNPDDGTDLDVAVWYLYINRCGYNGLYRVNKKGQYNTSYGTPKVPLLNERDILETSKALQNVALQVGSAFDSEAWIGSGDFAYLDPPYIPISATANFTAYTAEGFGMAEQTRLRDMAQRLRARGVHVLLSNSASEKTRRLYTDWNISEVVARRAVNCKAEKREGVREVLIF